MPSHQITIRPAVAADAATIAAIHCESWRDAYAGLLDPAYLAGPVEADRRAVWADRFSNPSPTQTILLAETVSGDAAGFVCLFRDHDPRWGSLVDNLHVRPVLRGRSIGEQLLRAAVAPLGADEAFHLWVFEANAGGVRFYQRLGGCVAGRAPDDMPAARGAPILRMVWQRAADLPSRD
ncbi:MAG: GNAT family N-acetyltransferase [Novosphingobium sp.]|uniref:GNAT family N-acetyltransferase n=1 Tax=Novosphingobium sp. NDB2Meth1 TaxID=1892847 RepID=UPI000931A41D|nr:GNAT family N-acetyltransferase [Novosphingobium sp. NDB2Meth1]MBY0393903.1 GNAT family N-acetyltransferase [Novosphingobium sp.]